MSDQNLEHDPFLAPGTKVRYAGHEDGEAEYGVVIHCWRDDMLDMHDCYVAFFGNEMPAGQPDEKPYVLRYGTGSLVVLD
ncbi:MAG: hypothetical protein AB8B94_17435 [Hyphomicrobiales bacterium]